MADGYAVARLDELESFPVDDEGLTWRPVRRHFDIQAFGVNAYTAEREGQRVVEEHSERDGPEELYVVLRGRATFTLGDDEVDAPAGTFVFVKPGTRRGAFAREADTAVLGIGAKPGEAYTPSKWELTFAAFGHRRAGRVEEGLELIRAAARDHPDEWQAHFNLACYESLDGRKEETLAALRRAIEIAPEGARAAARKDSDFDWLRDDPEFRELVPSEAG